MSSTGHHPSGNVTLSPSLPLLKTEITRNNNDKRKDQVVGCLPLTSCLVTVALGFSSRLLRRSSVIQRPLPVGSGVRSLGPFSALISSVPRREEDRRESMPVYPVPLLPFRVPSLPGIEESCVKKLNYPLGRQSLHGQHTNRDPISDSCVVKVETVVGSPGLLGHNTKPFDLRFSDP